MVGQGAADDFFVRDFGARGDGRTDDRAALQEAIHAAVEAGPGNRVVLEAEKVYRLGPQVEAFGMLLVEEAEGLTIEGNGATLLAHPSCRILAVFGSKNVAVCDLVLDYDPLPYTQATLTEVDPELGRVRFRVMPGYDEPVAGGSEKYRDFKSSDCVFIDGETGRFTHSWLRLAGIDRQANGSFTARFHGGEAHVRRQLRRTKVGDTIAIKMLYPNGEVLRRPDGRYVANGTANVNIAFSKNVLCRNITSYAAPGMTFNAHGSEGVRLEDCSVIRRPGTDRLIAGCSDGAHLKSLTVMPHICRCRFEALMDDSINIKVSSNVVREIDGRRLLLAHGDIAYNDVVLGAGDEVSLVSWAEKRHLGFATIVEMERIGYRSVRVLLDCDIPGLAVDDLVFLRPKTEAIVEDCHFGTQLKTALLVRPACRVDHCRFDDVAYGVHAFLADRIEGPVPLGIRVTDCEFVGPTVAGIAYSVPHSAVIPPGRRAVTAEGCRFVLTEGSGPAVNARNARGVVLKNLEISYGPERSTEEVVNLPGCEEVEREGILARESLRTLD